MSDVASKSQNASPAVGSAVRSAMIWNLVSMAVSQLAQGGIFILLTQRLAPDVFGLFAMAVVVTDLFYVLASTAAIDAVVQRQHFDKRTLSTAFWMVAAVTLPIMVIVVGGGGLFAGAVGEPAIAPIFAALALSLVPLPFSIGPYARMRQDLDYKGIAIRGMSASLIGGVCALVLAFTHWAEWALVFQRCLTLALAAGFMSTRARVFPTWQFDPQSARALLSLSSRIFVSHGVGAVGPRLTDLIFGIAFGPAVLGCLRVAVRLSDMAVAVLVNPINQMWVVLLSKAGTHGPARREVFLHLSKMIALLCLPGYVGLALVSSEITELALTPEYSQVASFLATLCAIGLLNPVVNSRNAVLTAMNRTGLLMAFSFMDLTVLSVAIFAVVRFGPEAALWATAAPAVASALVAVPILLKSLTVTKTDLVKAVMPPYVAVALMAIIILAVDPLFDEGAVWTTLLYKIALGAGIYASVLLIAFRTWTLGAIRSVASR